MKSRLHREHILLGAEGEERAARHLAGQGYRIVDRNVRAGGVELDIVARRVSLLIFVEVKTRRSTRFGAAELAVDAAKQRRLARGAAAWLHDSGHWARHVRFDVVGWQVSGRGESERWLLHHVEGAFDLSD